MDLFVHLAHHFHLKWQNYRERILLFVNTKCSLVVFRIKIVDLKCILALLILAVSFNQTSQFRISLTLNSSIFLITVLTALNKSLTGYPKLKELFSQIKQNMAWRLTRLSLTSLPFCCNFSEFFFSNYPFSGTM